MHLTEALHRSGVLGPAQVRDIVPISSLKKPVVQAVSNLHPRVWWNNLERIMMAVDDLGCRDLLA